MRRPVIVFLAVLLGVLFLPAGMGSAAAAVETEAAELAFVDEINRVRVSKGLSPLTIHPELIDVARGWASKMSAANEISHNPGLADAVQADWQKLGENVGVGTTVEGLHSAFVASPLHYKNIVDPAFTHIGVGVVVGRDGALFTTHQFMTLRPAAAAVEAKKAVEEPVRKAVEEPVKKAVDEPAKEQAKASPSAISASPPARLVLVLQQLRALDAR